MNDNRRVTNNVRVVVRSDEDPIQYQQDAPVGLLEPTDHLVCVGPHEIESVVPKFIDSTLFWPAISRNLTITCAEHGDVDLSPILDAAEKWIDADSAVTLHRCYVHGSILDRLLARWNDVRFIACAIGPGWQTEKEPSSLCQWLNFLGCTAAVPSEFEIGCATWPQLESLTVDENHWNRSLTFSTAIQPDPLLVHDSPYPANPSQLLKAFWGSGLNRLGLFDWMEPPQLHSFPELPELEDVDISGTPTAPSDLDWLVRHSKIEHLGLSWMPGTKLPWHRLAALSELQYLDVTSSPCNDEDLYEILDHTQLRTIQLYYSQVTPASWPRLFSAPSLKSVWVSTESLQGAQPTGLPTRTGLEEVVAMNARTEYLKELLKNYPGVEIVEM